MTDHPSDVTTITLEHHKRSDPKLIYNIPLSKVSSSSSMEVAAVGGGSGGGVFWPHESPVLDRLLNKLKFLIVDIASCYGPVWKEKRDFTWQTLRYFGFAKTSMESLIQEEVVKLLEQLKPRSNAKIRGNDLFFLSFFNIMWTIAGSNTFSIAYTLIL